VVTGALVLGLTGGAAAAAAPLLQPTEPRVTARGSVKPPLDLHRYASPLQGFRLNVTDNVDRILFTITGAPQGTRVRLATMDAYDGFTYNVTDTSQAAPDGGAFKRIGESVDDAARGTRLDVGITVGDYAGVWVPTVGQTIRARFEGPRGVAIEDSFYYNQATGSGVTPVGLVRGDTYRLTVVVAADPTPGQVTAATTAPPLTLPPAAPTPDVLRDLAAKWGAAGAGATIASYRDKLREGYYSHGVDPADAPSLPGHHEGRLEEVLADTAAMIGDEEQYAVVMALLARSAGVPARVVYGYVTAQAGTAQVKGSDVSAWTEVNLDGLGWVAVDATPPKDRKLPKVPEREQSVPRPQVENPPPPPQRPERADQDNSPPVQPAPKGPERPRSTGDSSEPSPWSGACRCSRSSSPSPVIGLKVRRRRERRNHDDLVHRVRAAGPSWSTAPATSGARPRRPRPVPNRPTSCWPRSTRWASAPIPGCSHARPTPRCSLPTPSPSPRRRPTGRASTPRSTDSTGRWGSDSASVAGCR
jgi:hypothetical protein